MAILVFFILLACTATATATATATNFTSPYTFNAKIGIAETQTNFSAERKTWKLEVVHRDRIHLGRFQHRMKHDAIRVASLVHQLGEKEVNYTVASFEGEVGLDLVSGEYFIPVGLGTPPTQQYLVMDIGSDIVWVQCLPCVQCSHRPQPIFDPAHSSSYFDIPCNSLACNLLPKKNCQADRCLYDITYGDGSYSRGNLALENLAFGDLLIKKFALGCSHSNNGNFGETGIMGLGRGMFSIQNQIGYLIGGAFTYCLPSRGGGSSGSLVLGRDAIPMNAAWVPLLSNAQAPSFYYVGLVGLGVNGIRLPLSEDIFQITKSGHGGVIMDTGTTVTRFPKLVYEAFRDAYIAQNPSLPRAPGVEILDLCYDSELQVTSVSTVSFYFSGGTILTLAPQNFIIRIGDLGTYCFAFAPSPSTFSIIGNVQQEGIQITFDVGYRVVGFGPNLC